MGSYGGHFTCLVVWIWFQLQIQIYKMADDSNAGTDISYNVAVAKRMTVPDEIRLTGPPRQTKSTVPSSTMESDRQLEKTSHPDTYVVGDVESATSNGNKSR